MARTRISEAQANAEALARRSATYADEHAASWKVRFDRGGTPPDLRALVNMVRTAYADEVPTRLHVHQTDAGGDPAWSPEFTRYLTDSDYATDDDVYRTAFRRCLAAMSRSDGPMARDARIVARIAIGGAGPSEAAIAERSHPYDAKGAAISALQSFWKRYSDFRYDLRRTETAA